MSTVTIHQAKTNLSKLLNAMLEGEEIIIARGKEPIARLTPIYKQGKRRYGSLKGLMEIPQDSAFAPLTDDELEEWGLL